MAAVCPVLCLLGVREEKEIVCTSSQRLSNAMKIMFLWFGAKYSGESGFTGLLCSG